ncbi:MAG TPA: hypothetical protein VFM99_04235 [Chitinophagales bacterium]|nr:hypothetical protein [Chitinophagales bacterium]
MLKSLIVIIFISTCFQLIGQTSNELFLFIDDSTIIGKISGNNVQTSENSIDYTLQGNIIFKGESKKTTDILFVINAKDVLGKKAGIVYQNDSKTVQYISIKGNFYFGDYPIQEELDKLLSLEKLNDSTILIKSGINDSVLGEIRGKSFNTPKLIIAAHIYIMHFELDQQVIHQIQQFSESSGSSLGGIIRLLNNSNYYFEWQWDGKTLQPLNGSRPEDEWKFDGKYFRQVWNLDPQNEWVWENNILKPSWDSNPETQWYWENNTLRKYWTPEPENTWVLDENIIRPMWNYNPNAEWEIIGEVPLPVIAMIILGIADRP